MATRNPARKPVEVGSSSHLWPAFMSIPGGWELDFCAINYIFLLFVFLPGHGMEIYKIPQKDPTCRQLQKLVFTPSLAVSYTL